METLTESVKSFNGVMIALEPVGAGCHCYRHFYTFSTPECITEEVSFRVCKVCICFFQHPLLFLHRAMDVERRSDKTIRSINRYFRITASGNYPPGLASIQALRRMGRYDREPLTAGSLLTCFYKKKKAGK